MSSTFTEFLLCAQEGHFLTIINYYFSPYPPFLLLQPQFLPRSLGENSFPTTTISVGCTLVTWREIPFQLQFSARFFSEALDSPQLFPPTSLTTCSFVPSFSQMTPQLVADLSVVAQPTNALFPSALPRC